MPDVKCVLIFRSNEGYGWTETHWWGTSADTPNLDQRIQVMDANLCPARRNMLGEDCAIVGLRASYKTPNGIASKNAAPYYPGIPGAASASQNDSLAQLMYGNTNTRKKIIHFRGFWDLLVSDEHYAPNTPEGSSWVIYLNTYLNQLIAGAFGWEGKNPATSVYGWVNNYVTNTNGTVTFTVSALGNNPLPFTNQPVSVRFSKINKSNSVLNRTITCLIDAPVAPATVPTQITTLYPISAGPFTSFGRFYLNMGNFIQYTNYAVNPQLGERRMGKVIGIYPGRGRRRPVT
jgi:hypothetical protein